MSFNRVWGDRIGVGFDYAWQADAWQESINVEDEYRAYEEDRIREEKRILENRKRRLNERRKEEERYRWALKYEV